MATRTVRREAEKRDIEKEMLQNCLLDLLRDEDNRYCVDCDAKGPRWAAWNIGVFLCIRCAGIHRKLGVHISKVKSVNLDSWTPEQVQSMRVVGNSMARGVYEAGMPEHFRRPQSDQSLESFIRAKYEQKRYIMKDWVKPKVDVADLPIYGELQELWKHGTVRIKSSSMQKVGAPKPAPPPASANQAKAGIQAPATPQKQEPSPTPVAVEKPKPSAMNDLLDLSMPAAATSTVPTSLFPTNSSSNAIDDLLGLDSTPNQPQTSPGGLHPVASAPSLTTGDLFGDFTSHQPTSPAAQSAISTPVQPVDSTKSKQDIMALFASGSSGPGGNPGPTVPQPNPMVVPGPGLGPNPFGQPVASGPPRPGVPGSMMFPGQQPGFPPMNMNPQPVGGFPQLQQQQQFPFGAPQAPAPNNNMAGVRAQFGQMSFGTPGAAGMNANTLANNLWQ